MHDLTLLITLAVPFTVPDDDDTGLAALKSGTLPRGMKMPHADSRQQQIVAWSLGDYERVEPVRVMGMASPDGSTPEWAIEDGELIHDPAGRDPR